MAQKAPMKMITLDAQGKPLGRLASEIALLLQGKRQVDFRREAGPTVLVTINHASGIVLTGNKDTQLFSYRSSRYPGGLKKTSVGERLQKEPARVLHDTVARMLPRNRQRSRFLQNLIITP